MPPPATSTAPATPATLQSAAGAAVTSGVNTIVALAREATAHDAEVRLGEAMAAAGRIARGLTREAQLSAAVLECRAAGTDADVAARQLAAGQPARANETFALATGKLASALGVQAVMAGSPALTEAVTDASGKVAAAKRALDNAAAATTPPPPAPGPTVISADPATALATLTVDCARWTRATLSAREGLLLSAGAPAAEVSARRAAIDAHCATATPATTPAMPAWVVPVAVGAVGLAAVAGWWFMSMAPVKAPKGT